MRSKTTDSPEQIISSNCGQGHNGRYRIYSRISRPAYKPTPIPKAENVAKISDPRISQ